MYCCGSNPNESESNRQDEARRKKHKNSRNNPRWKWALGGLIAAAVSYSIFEYGARVLIYVLLLACPLLHLLMCGKHDNHDSAAGRHHN